MLPSTNPKASAPRTSTFSVLISPAHPYRYRRFACPLAGTDARLAEKRGSVTPSFQGTCTPYLLPVRLAHIAVGTPVTRRPPAQIRAGALTHTAPASGQTSAALSATCRLARLRGPQAACVTRTRHSVRYVLWPVDLPLAPVLRSIDSAGTLIPLFADFTATMTESDSSSPFVSGYDSSVFPSRPRH